MIAFGGLLSGIFTGAANDILDVIERALDGQTVPPAPHAGGLGACPPHAAVTS